MARATGRASGQGRLRAGAARIEITAAVAEASVRDPLYAKALVLDDGATRVVLVAMDTTAIGGRRVSQGVLADVGEEFLPRLRSRIEREWGIPADQVLVNASHTHPPGRLLCDDDAQVDRVYAAVDRAARGLVPVRVGAGVGREDRITINRDLRMRDGRDWTIRHANPCPPDDEVVAVGPIDPEIPILRIDRLDGSPLAVVYNFACHPLFGDVDGRITANFPGVASRLIEEALGHGAMALFLQGAGGNVVDVLFKDFGRPRDVEPLGTALAMSVLSALRGIATHDADLSVRSRTLELPRRTDIPQRLADLRREQAGLLESLSGTTLNFRAFLPMYLQRALDPAHPSDYSYRYLQDEATGRDAHRRMDAWKQGLVQKYLRNIRAMERLAVIQDDLATLTKHQAINAEAGSPTATAEVQGIRIGECAVITSPAELLVEIGLRLKAGSPHRHTMVAPFTNGYLHYGAPVEAYERGGYEVVECLLAPEWQRLYEDAALDILRRL